MHSFTAKMLLWFSVLVLRVFCQDCNVQNGKDGLDGKPGRDGRAGAKGDKGDPSESVLYELKGRKGDAGDKGLIGEQGLKGLPGEVGLMGPPGVQGIKGLPAMKTDRSQERQSAFSVQRTNTVIEYGKPLTFQKVLSNHNTVFNSERSKFICKEPGVYYFVFHAMPSGNLCLKIKSDALETEGLGFCEYGDESRGNTPVLSGGVVLKLRETQAVWLEVFKENDKASYKDLKSIVVTGFMI